MLNSVFMVGIVVEMAVNTLTLNKSNYVQLTPMSCDYVSTLWKKNSLERCVYDILSLPFVTKTSGLNASEVEGRVPCHSPKISRENSQQFCIIFILIYEIYHVIS